MRNLTLRGTAGLLLVGTLLSACGSGSSAGPVAQTPMPATAIVGQTSAGVLTLAETPTETEDALVVGTDAIATADLNDETSDPLPAI